MQAGGQGAGEELGARVVDGVLQHEGGLDQVVLLLHVGIPELFPGLEAAGVARFKGEELVAELLQAAVAQHEFQGRAQVHLRAGAHVGFAVDQAGLVATADHVVEHFAGRGALGQHAGDQLLVIEQLGIALPLLDGLGHVPQEALRRTRVDAHGQVGIVGGELALGLEQQVG